MVNLVGKQDSFKAPVSLIQSADLAEDNLIICMSVYILKVHRSKHLYDRIK